MRLLDQRQLVAARLAPRGPHVDEHDLALVVRERADAVPAEHRQAAAGGRIRRARPSRHRVVERRVGPGGREAVREQADEQRGGDGDGPVDAGAHAPQGYLRPIGILGCASAGVVQWPRRWLPKPKMGVRFPSPALPPVCRRRPAPSGGHGGAGRAAGRSERRLTWTLHLPADDGSVHIRDEGQLSRRALRTAFAALMLEHVPGGARPDGVVDRAAHDRTATARRPRAPPWVVEPSDG